LPYKKNAAYELLKNPRHNWRKFLLVLAVKMVGFFSLLVSEEREKVLIFDDSVYDRSRSKVVELLAWVFDHNSGKSLKGFKLLTLGWSEGASFLPLDFVLCSSAKENTRVQGIKKELDKRTVGFAGPRSLPNLADTCQCFAWRRICHKYFIVIRGSG